MEDERKQQGERLKTARESLGIKQGVFASKIGMEQGSLSDIERGRKKLSNVAFRRVAQHFGINPTWVMTGEGEMQLSSNEQLNATLRNSIELPIKALRSHYTKTIARITGKSVQEIETELKAEEDDLP
jgi:transcriptional regulator with XRE-family HTH domain